jgi:hypothetical protein
MSELDSVYRDSWLLIFSVTCHGPLKSHFSYFGHAVKALLTMAVKTEPRRRQAAHLPLAALPTTR